MKRSADGRSEKAGTANRHEHDRCAYTHDVSAFEDVEGNEWQCPRSVSGDRERCRFHLPADRTSESGVDDETFLNAVRSPAGDRDRRRERKRFFGARFGDLDLKHAIIDSPDNCPIDLRDTCFEGDLDLTKAVVEVPLWLDGASIDGELRCERTRFAEHVSLCDIVCTGEANCDRATFDHHLNVDDAQFRADASFYAISVAFVSFVDATVEGEFDFHQVDVRDNAHLHDMRVEGATNFSKIEANARFWCFNNVFEGPVEMEKAVVGGPAFFDYTEFRDTVNYWNTTFEGRVRWKETVFGGDVDASDLATRSTAKCLRPKIGADIDLSRLDATRGLVVTEPTVTARACRIVLERATIRGGCLEGAVEGELMYDLTEASVGDVRVNPDASKGFVEYHFDRTRFEGFDFTSYHEVFDRTNWRLFPTGDSDREVDFHTAEETYLKAKNGAKTVGDTTAAAEFFRKEMVYRRYNHARRAKDADESGAYRSKAAGRWFASGLLDLTTGYGERPWRVIACSAGIIGAFAAIYAVVLPAPPYDTTLGYLVFSIESFVALVLGGAARIQTPFVRFIAQVEGFMGAFFIALFVFTLTRSIQR